MTGKIAIVCMKIFFFEKKKYVVEKNEERIENKLTKGEKLTEWKIIFRKKLRLSEINEPEK